MLNVRMLLPGLCFLLTTAGAHAQAPSSEPEGPPVRRVAIFLFPRVELLDFAGPGEIFQAARRETGAAFEVFTVAEQKEKLVSQQFLTIVPEYSFDDCPKPDILVIPGGAVPHRKAEVIAWLREVAEEAELLMSVCNGAALLAKAGFLDGREATTHWGSLDFVQIIAPKARLLSGPRFVDTGSVVTTAGVSAGIDGALHVVSRLIGREAAERTARYMEYEWQREPLATRRGEPVVGRPHFVLLERLQKEGLEKVVSSYPPDAEPIPELPAEDTVNQLAYGLLQSHRVADAILLFRFNVEVYPDSPNVYDSLADGYEAAGETERAIALSHETLARLEKATGQVPRRDRIRESAVKRLQRLKKNGSP